MMKITFKPIGTIHTPFTEKEGMPIQSKAADGVRGQIVIYDDYVAGLADLDGFSHIILSFYFHQSVGFELKTKPFLDSKQRGVFSTRAPRRPNAIGVSVVKLLSIENNTLHIENVDIMDGTPLLDIKPYIPDFDVYEVEKYGWIENNIHKLDQSVSDDRFS